MATKISEAGVARSQVDAGVVRQRLVVRGSVPRTNLQIDRITLGAGATMHFNLPANAIAWVQMLQGEAKFNALYTDRLTETHTLVLPPSFDCVLTSATGATLLYVEIADAQQIDRKFPGDTPVFVVLDWMRETVFESEQDARKRISLINPHICMTETIKVDMVIYPSGCRSPEHHMAGAATFMYFLTGRGTAWSGDQPYPVSPGDLISFADGETHYVKAEGAGELRFLEFHVPGDFKVVWADPKHFSAWRSTGQDIHGWETELDMKQRKAFRFVFPFATP